MNRNVINFECFAAFPDSPQSSKVISGTVREYACAI